MKEFVFKFYFKFCRKKIGLEFCRNRNKIRKRIENLSNEKKSSPVVQVQEPWNMSVMF